jgi:hypothetical protein
MIIVEGCNGAGKSTLIETLLKEFPEYIKFKDSRHFDGIQYYINKSLDFDRNTIFDRFHLGETVYPILKEDGRDPLDDWQQRLIEMILISRGAVLIYCEVSDHQTEEVYRTRGEDFITLEQSSDEKKLFQYLFKKSILPKLKFNWQNEDLNLLKDTVTTIFNWQNENIDFISHCDKYQSIGYEYPNVILVGDKINDSVATIKNPRAFASMSKSSLYLHKTLGKYNPEVKYYLTNSKKSKGKGKLEKELEYMKEKNPKVKIIALGHNAKDLMNKQGIKFDSMFAHPEYWMEVHKNEQKIYANNIK